MVYQVRDLSPEQKHAAEVLLGHPVAEDESISIKTIPPATIIPPKLTPQEAVDAWHALCEKFGDRPEVDPVEEEEAYIEAMRSVRPNFRPVR